MSTRSPTRAPTRRICDVTVTSISTSFTYKMAAKTSWHRYGTKLRHCQRRRNGVGTTGALAPAMLKPRGREYLIARAIFSHIFARCSLNFHSSSLCCLHTIKTSHSVGARGRILRNKLMKHTSPAKISVNKNSANACAYSHKMFAPAMLKSKLLNDNTCRNVKVVPTPLVTVTLYVYIHLYSHKLQPQNK